MAQESPEPDFIMRAYEPRDREAVRGISYDTADGGRPGVRICRNREFIADVLTRYYTDWEPESLSVVESQGKVVGYLTGCLDTRRQLRITLRKVLPRAALRAVLRGALFHANAWRLAWSAVRLYLSGGAERGVNLDEYPAHLHVDILEGYRGRRSGAALMERFIAQAKAAGAVGVHLSAREDNAPARRFFEKYDFDAIGRQPTLLVPAGAEAVPYSVVYGKRLT